MKTEDEERATIGATTTLHHELWPEAVRVRGAPPIARGAAAADFVVVVADDASPGERFAAAELAHILGNLTDPRWSPGAGAGSPPLRRTAELRCAAPNRLVVGYTAATQNLGVDRAELNASALGNDGFVLWQMPAQGANGTFPGCSGTCVALAGAQPSARAGKRGAMYAVYELVERLGVRFLSHDETLWPATVRALPAFGKIVQPQPQVAHRGLEDWPLRTHALWGLRARMVPGTYHVDHPGGKSEQVGPYLGPPYGSLSVNWTNWTTYNYAHPAGGCHSIYRLLEGGPASLTHPPTDLLKQHPEWFWPRNGPLGNESHVYGQVCWSNQSLVQYLIKQVKAELAAQPSADKISVTQNDNILFCRTPEENAIATEEGSDVGPMLRAVNARPRNSDPQELFLGPKKYLLL
jgi:hypothetical protein